MPESADPVTLPAVPTPAAPPAEVVGDTSPSAAAPAALAASPALSEHKPAITLSSATAQSAVAEPEPLSRSSSNRRLADEQDDSSISAEFFRQEEDSLPPLIDSHGDEHQEPLDAPVVLTPETIARRARLRRVVAGVVAFASVISIAVIGKAVLGRKPVPPTTNLVAVQEVKTTVALPAPPPPPKVVETPAPKPTATEEPKAVAETPKAEVTAEPAATEVADKGEPKAGDKDHKASEPKSSDSPGDAEAMKKETLSLLNRGKLKDAIEMARSAIAADPSDALVYLYLGSALQDSGKWKDGIDAYCDCVRNATRGPVNECRQMGGHK
jgi:hypothetical protein